MHEITHHSAVVNGVRMHYVMAGEGPLLLLLHGFPQFWYCWRHQLAALGAHFCVVAPDLRGYNETDKPDWGYTVDVLTADVVEFVQALGYQRACVVGHDWGGVLAWELAITYPHRVERLVTLNMPHPSRMQQALATNPRQMARSIYMALFQLPLLPEALLRAGDYALLDWMMRGTATSKTAFDDETIEVYKDAASKPGALTAALNWYRGLLRDGELFRFAHRQARVEVPTLMIWGQQDPALEIELSYDTELLVPNLRLEYVPDSSHWVQEEQPELVNRYLREFLL